jgi:SAM-dependent methyltransferase
MGTIYISYGITKSASTFAWQLIKRIAIAGGIPVATLTRKSKGANSPEDYIDPISDETIRAIQSDVGDLPVVIKTHGPVTPAAVQLVVGGQAKVFASYRDLRDVALSLLDHGARSRRMGIRDFAEFHELSDTIGSIEVQIRRFDDWVKSCEPLLIRYDEICFDTRKTIVRVAECLGVSVDIDSIFHDFEVNKTSIGQFNRGQKNRFEHEMDAAMSRLFLRKFDQYYRNYFPVELTKLSVSSGEPLVTTNTGRIPSKQASSVTNDDVLWCYRHLLGREPESQSVVDRQVARWPDFRGLVMGLLNSPEYHKKRAQTVTLVPFDGPRMAVQLDTSPAEMSDLKGRIRNAWTHLGATCPYFSVLTGRAYQPDNVDDNALDEFWASGKRETVRIQGILRRVGYKDDLNTKTCVEYGCGVGRVTTALAGIFAKVYAYDISANHLQLAKERAENLQQKNIEFCPVDGKDNDLEGCDVFYSRLVFQHNPPPIIRELIAKALGSLRAGGIAIFQVPTYGIDYSFNVQDYLTRKVQTDMEMHFFPQSAIFELVATSRCRVLEVWEDNSIGQIGRWISNMFVVQRAGF